MGFQTKITDWLKLSAYAFFPALIATMFLGFLGSALASLAFVNFFVLGIVLIWAVKELPKDMESFWNIIILVLFLLGIQGLIGLIFPIPQLQWASIATFAGFLTTIVGSAVGVALVEKFM